MKLDKQPPTTTVPSDPLAASGKPKKWANVRRKFALIVANRNSGTHHHHHSHHHSHHNHPPPDEEAASQAESFCRPYIQNGSAGLLLRAADREPDREMEFAQVTKENSERNKEITSPLYSAPKSTAAAAAAKRKKKGPRKIVRFIEEPYVILDQEDAGSIDSREEEAEVDVDVGVDVDVDAGVVMAGVKALQLRTGSGPATIRVVRQ